MAERDKNTKCPCCGAKFVFYSNDGEGLVFDCGTYQFLVDGAINQSPPCRLRQLKQTKEAAEAAEGKS